MQTRQTTGIAIMVAIVIVLQVFATAINFVTPGTIPIVLVLPPIIIGAAMFGVKAGMILGFCFGLVVLGSGIFGFAPTSAMMWSVSPVIMTVGTLGRGLAVGFTAGILYNLLKKKSTYLGVISAAIAVPFVNTGIFTIVFFLFLEVLAEEGAGRTILQYASGFIIAVNFLIELIFNIVLASAIVRIIEVVKKRRQ
ncbi:MAG: ECF transporter S component [Defluviitaleaceae bacterium]|nr:ECF transporter S component [Defluviitaleaceae bacterium]